MLEEYEIRLQRFIECRLKEEGTINAMMNMAVSAYCFQDKSVTLSFSVAAWQLNPAGNMHGGMICTALDISMGCVAYIFGSASFTPTISMAVNFVSSIPLGAVLEIEAFCDHGGSRMAQVHAIAKIKSTGRIGASANGSYIMNK